MKTIFILTFTLLPAWGQLSPATGDDFTIAIYNDVHADRCESGTTGGCNDGAAWGHAADWMLGENGRGPGGMSAIAYYNIKSINSVGDYTDPCTGAGAACNAAWASFTPAWNRILAANKPGVWAQGNHDIAGAYATDAAGLSGVFYGSDTTQQYRLVDVGNVKIGIIAVGFRAPMEVGSPDRIWVDSVIAAHESNRQWIFIRHIITDQTSSPNPAPAYFYPTDGNTGWYTNASELNGNGDLGTNLRDNFLQHSSRVFWAVGGHLKYVARLSLNADDGHTVNVTGNLGGSGGAAGWITLLKFRPSHNDIQWAVYLTYGATVTGFLYSGPYTWAWTPETETPSTATYNVQQITYQDCSLVGCGGKVQDGDTTIFQAWMSTGSHTVNGTTVTGDLYGTTNDSNIYYNPDPAFGPNCYGRSIQWLKIPAIQMNGAGGSVYSSNCMTSYAPVAGGDPMWPPADPGTCYAGDTGGSGGSPSNCDWKSQGVICFDGACYLNVLRQEKNSGSPHPFRGHDSTLIKTTNKGVSWLNPAHLGGSPDVNGDAPAGPGSATYPSSILWPDPAAHNGSSQHMARLEFIQYGRDGAVWPSVDSNATYIYALAYTGDFSNFYLARGLRSNPMVASSWSLYKCATYPTTICDGSSSLNWDANQANGTAIMDLNAQGGLGGVMYSAELGVYVMTGGNIGMVAVNTAPHPWGPWTLSGRMAFNPIPGASLGFVAPILSTATTIAAGRVIQFTVSATEYTVSGAGTVAYATYELSKIGGTGGAIISSGGLFPLPMPVATTTTSTSADLVTGISVTNTQAAMTYTTPFPASACTWESSLSPGLTPLAHDVNPALFTGANSDGGGDATRTFVIGKRIVETALDSANYSRALQAHTIYYYRLTCGSTVATGQFRTANIPVNMTYQDLPQLDSTSPGSTVQPSLVSTASITDRTQTIVDAKTGALLKRVSLTTDSPYNSGNPATFGPFLYFSGAPRVCGIPTVGPDSGHLCKFAQGDGGPESFYYIIPGTGETRYLGWARPGTMNESNNKFYAHADLPSHAINETTYTGTWVDRTNGANAIISTTTLISDLQSAVTAFDATFDPSAFDCYPTTAVGDFLHFSCSRSEQDSNAWVGAVRISTASVVAAARVDDNIKCRWCAMHQIVPAGYDEPMYQIILHEYTGDSTGNKKGQGPYKTTITSNINSSTTTINVAGEPDCIPCGADTTVPVARVGDVFGIGSELVQITTKTSSTVWQVTRGVRSTTAASHTSGDVVNAACDMKVIMWKFLADPHGSDTTNTNWVQDTAWTTATDQGHDDATANLLMSEAADGWVTRVGDNITKVGQPVTEFISSALNFGGKSANCFGNGCRKHPSVGYPASPWFTDFPLFDFVAPNGGNHSMSNVSGQLYKLGAVVGTGINPKHFAIAGVVGAVFVGSGSPFSFLDVSGPASTIGTTSGDNYKMCIANAANECRSGSVSGEIYVNVPGSPNLSCGTNTDVCIANFSKYANGVVQIGAAGGYGRVVSAGLAGLRKGGDFPTAKQVGASWVLFAVGDQGNYKPSQVLMAKLPPFYLGDIVDRSTFVRAPIPITAPTGSGIATATVEFGYLEQGTIAQHYCTSRREACVAVSSTVTDATPFSYVTTDAYTRLPCATSCTITLPVLPGHIANYQVKFYDAGGAFVQNGTSGYAVEGKVL